MGAPTAHWQYRWLEDVTGEIHGPFDSAMMSKWQQENVFAQQPALVRRCGLTGQLLEGQIWRPADQVEFGPLAAAGTSDTPADMNVAAAIELANMQAAQGEVVTRSTAASQRDSGYLAKLWWELSRPRKRGKIGSASGKHIGESQSLIQQWLSAREVEHTLVQEADQQNFQVYRFARNTLTPAQESWDQAFHGTRWYALWLILASGVMLASDNKEAGHDFWEPGVYCTPVLGTARWYGIPHILFGDEIYHRVVIELKVDPARRKKNRQRGGVQWVFPADATVIRAIWIQSNAPPDADERRFVHWDHELEALPPGKSCPATISNPRRPPSSEYDKTWYQETKQKMLSDSLSKPAAKPGTGTLAPPKLLPSPGSQPLLPRPAPVPNNGSSLATLAQNPTIAASGGNSFFQNLAAAERVKREAMQRQALANIGISLPTPAAVEQPKAAPAGSLAALLSGVAQTPATPAKRPTPEPEDAEAKRRKFLAFAGLLARTQGR